MKTMLGKTKKRSILNEESEYSEKSGKKDKMVVESLNIRPAVNGYIIGLHKSNGEDYKSEDIICEGQEELLEKITTLLKG